MPELPPFNYLFLFQEYVVGAAAITFATILILYRLKINQVSISLSMFGFSIALWDVLVFFHRTAETAPLSLQIFKVIGMVHPFLLGFFFLTFLNIYRPRMLNALCLAPSALGSLFYTLFVDYDMAWGSFGWSYRTIIAPQASFFINLFTPFYMASILFVLAFLWLKAFTKSLRRKIMYILVSFIVFQAVGVTVTNIILLQQDPNFPPLGGLFYLATFAVIYYVSSSPERERLTLVPLGYSKMAEDFSKLVNSFIESLSKFPEQLGIRYFRIVSYLNERGLGSLLLYDGEGSRILLNVKGDVEVEKVNSFIDLSLTLLEEGEVEKGFEVPLVEFVNRNYGMLGAGLVHTLKRHERYIVSQRLFEKFSDRMLKQIFLPKGFTEEDLEAFSRRLGLSHEELRKSQVLVEFDSEKYLSHVSEFVRECLSNNENVYVFTRKGGALEEALAEYERVEFLFLSPTASKVARLDGRRRVVPVSDPSSILGVFSTVSREGCGIVFDSLSDIILLTSFEQAYKMVRHALDIISNTGSHSLFLINRSVHGKEVLSAFETLFKHVVR